MNSQELWERCQFLADCLLRKPNMLVQNLTGKKREDVRNRIAEAIYNEQQAAYDQTYRFASRELGETLPEGGEAWARDAYESVLEFLRPMIADDIDARLEYEEQCVKEQHEQAPEWVR